jgi:hypothetical protein
MVAVSATYETKKTKGKAGEKRMPVRAKQFRRLR